MKEKNNCKIIQDLFPSYIEGLTSKETNEYIEEHVSNCEECKSILNNMCEEIKINNKKNNAEEVRYMKKFKNKTRILSASMIIIIVLILIIIVGIFSKKYMILKEISHKSQDYKIAENFHILEYYYVEGHITKMEQFKMDGKNKFSYTMETPEGTITQTTYGNKVGDTYIGNTYLEKENKKYMKINDRLDRELPKESVLYSASFIDLIKYSMNTTIKTTTFRNKECYYLTNIPVLVGGTYQRVYIDKETGLMIGSSQIDDTQNSATPIEAIYEYGTVTEKDFIEPDASEYEIVEDLY